MPEDDERRSAAEADNGDSSEDDDGQPRTEPARESDAGHRGRPGREILLPTLVIVLAILIGAGGIATAIIVGFDRLDEPDSNEANVEVFDGPACTAWEDARRELEAIPPLKPPEDKNKNSPEVAKALEEQRAALGPVLNTFELRIDDLPDDEVTTLAKRYIAAQRSKMERQANGTAAAIDYGKVNAGYTWLNQACGLPN